MNIAGELADLKGSHPPGSKRDNAQKQCFLEAIDSTLRHDVGPQLKPRDAWDQMAVVEERSDAIMYRTGRCKGCDRNQPSSNMSHRRKKDNT